MQLVLVSGLSGSGKSIALKALEDAGYFAVDNLPATLIGALLESLNLCGEGQKIALYTLWYIVVNQDPLAARLRYEEALNLQPGVFYSVDDSIKAGIGICYAKIGQQNLAIKTWTDQYREALSQSDGSRLAEIFFCIGYALLDTLNDKTANLCLKLLGWYQGLGSDSYPLSTDLVELQERCVAISVEPSKKQGAGLAIRPEAQRRLLRAIAQALLDKKHQLKAMLSSKELEVLRCVAVGLSNKEVAKQLKITPRTVESHIYNMFAKTETNNRTELIHKAQELGFLESPV